MPFDQAGILAPEEGFEPPTLALTVRRTTAVLPWNDLAIQLSDVSSL